MPIYVVSPGTERNWESPLGEIYVPPFVSTGMNQYFQEAHDRLILSTLYEAGMLSLEQLNAFDDPGDLQVIVEDGDPIEIMEARDERPYKTVLELQGPPNRPNEAWRSFWSTTSKHQGTRTGDSLIFNGPYNRTITAFYYENDIEEPVIEFVVELDLLNNMRDVVEAHPELEEDVRHVEDRFAFDLSGWDRRTLGFDPYTSKKISLTKAQSEALLVSLDKFMENL